MASQASVREFTKKALLTAVTVLRTNLSAEEQLLKLLFLGTKQPEDTDMLEHCSISDLTSLEACAVVNLFPQNLIHYMEVVSEHHSSYARDEVDVCLTAYALALDVTLNTVLKQRYDDTLKTAAVVSVGLGLLGTALKFATPINPIAGVIGVGMSTVAGKGAAATAKNWYKGYQEVSSYTLSIRGAKLNPVVNTLICRSHELADSFIQIYSADEEGIAA